MTQTERYALEAAHVEFGDMRQCRRDARECEEIEIERDALIRQRDEVIERYHKAVREIEYLRRRLTELQKQ